MSFILASLAILLSTTHFLAAHQPAGGVAVNSFVLATDVKNREPEGIQENFRASDRNVYAFASVNAREDGSLSFCWSYEGKPYYTYTAKVQSSPRWRTFCSVRALPGKWTVSLKTQGGAVLQEKSFSVFQKEEQVSAESSEESLEKGKTVKEVLTSLEPQENQAEG